MELIDNRNLMQTTLKHSVEKNTHIFYRQIHIYLSFIHMFIGNKEVQNNIDYICDYLECL